MASCNSTYFTYNSPVGRITIASDGTSITTLAFGEVALEGIRKATDITNRAANQLQEYFAGKRTAFDLPLNPTG
ncbi:MAG: cysteine methyltransferase, partial [Raoultibacter sp.]